ncbi:MAG: 4-hydroxy-tetrahydrodipicolinate synthase [Acidobacteria bacterium RIFCSPLOWO2_12_FULL_54_10]|nr:MAG: 4-hydroxy-tetrahydrodipicolinate synthase [Acidobacteria bacterium RIFCSPLOWO2_12_FULL_54_10]
MSKTPFTGCGTALVTPFHADGSLDESALRRHVQFQIDNGIDFLVPCGTTGESPVLNSMEHFRVVEIVLEEARGRVPVMAGAGGNNTAKVREGIAVLERMGVQAILSVTPYYNKPTQEGLYQHYHALATTTRLPILVYNVPGRTGVNLEPRTLLRLSAFPNILGVKEASGNISQVDEILRTLPGRFHVLSGDDALTLPMMSLGAVGVISVVSNIMPREMTQMVAHCNQGDFSPARQLHRKLAALMQALFVEANPIPVKFALAAMSRIELAYRLPLVPPQPDTQAKIRKVLEDLQLLSLKETQYVAGGTN